MIREAGAPVVRALEFDADDLAAQPALLDLVAREHGEPDVVVLAFGVLGDQARAEHDAEHATAVLHTDYVAQVAALTHVADRLRTAGRGEIVVFSSIAGVRVRRANYVYGSAKAGLDGFASGLADALHGSGVHLVLVRPGFVVGRMTAGSGLVPGGQGFLGESDYVGTDRDGDREIRRVARRRGDGAGPTSGASGTGTGAGAPA